MKYIISEAQYQLLKEHDWDLWVKRRISSENMRPHIDSAIEVHPNPCQYNEYDYVMYVIDWAVEDFMSSNEEIYNSDRFDDYFTLLEENCKNWFVEELFDIHRDGCGDEDTEVKM
jgi:hypothetical protein